MGNGYGVLWIFFIWILRMDVICGLIGVGIGINWYFLLLGFIGGGGGVGDCGFYCVDFFLRRDCGGNFCYSFGW